MAHQLVQNSRSGNPPPHLFRWKGGREKGAGRGKETEGGRGGISEGKRGVGVLPHLHGEQDEERHHQTEETHSLRQSKAQDGIGEELLLQGGVPVEESTEESNIQSGYQEHRDTTNAVRRFSLCWNSSLLLHSLHRFVRLPSHDPLQGENNQYQPRQPA